MLRAVLGTAGEAGLSVVLSQDGPRPVGGERIGFVWAHLARIGDHPLAGDDGAQGGDDLLAAGKSALVLRGKQRAAGGGGIGGPTIMGRTSGGARRTHPGVPRPTLKALSFEGL